MMAQRSLIRPPQMDSEGSYQFAQLVLDGYSGGDTQDGYLMAFELYDGYLGGSTTLKMDAHDGAINQIGSGQVTFTGNVDAKNGIDVTGGNLNVTNNAVINGNLTVLGTETIINTEQMYVEDPITVINDAGSELLSSWTGLSERDSDGYNRTGWVFTGGGSSGTDGYFGLSVSADVWSDAVPTRAIAYLGEGDGYGDLSSTLDGDSGANKIGVTPTAGIISNNVQDALEELDAEITLVSSQINSDHFTLNVDATAGLLENACFISKAGSGTALVDGYYCLVPDDSGGDRLQFTLYRSGVLEDVQLHVGQKGVTDDVNSCVVLNSGDGVATHTASLCLDGTTDTLTITAPTIKLDGDIELGTGPEDCIIFNGVICSNIIPCCDDAYDVGSPTKRFNDGYFTNLDVENFNVENLNVDDIKITNLTVDGYSHLNGEVIIGDSSADCVIFNASVCSDIIPCCDDAYQLGTTSKRWIDGYFTMPTFTNFTPVGDVNSLIGVLEGIDNAIAPVLRGIYLVTLGEDVADAIDTSRAVDQGNVINVETGISDADFKDDIYIYWNGQLLWNDAAPATSKLTVQHDVARKTVDLKTILFSGNLKRNSVIQIVNMTK